MALKGTWWWWWWWGGGGGMKEKEGGKKDRGLEREGRERRSLLFFLTLLGILALSETPAGGK